MKNPNFLFAFLMLGLIFTLAMTTSKPEKVVVLSLPESQGCVWPVKIIKRSKTEIKRVVPYVQVHKCKYDSKNRLIRVSTYNFEVGYQMKKPTREVFYKWNSLFLSQYSIRKASHGNGDIDIEVFNFHY